MTTQVVGPHIESIAFVTRDRPFALRRALDSYGDCIREHRPGPTAPRLIIFDDSRDPATVAENKFIALAASDRFGVDVAYVGSGDRAAIAQALIAEGLSRETVTFALLGTETSIRTVGANRNAVLLEAHGGCAMSVDDDTECRITAAPAIDDLVHLNAPEMIDPVFPCVLESFKDRAALMRAHPFVNGDVLSMNEKYLGKQAPAPEHRDGALDGSSGQPFAGGPRTVKLTLPGLAGDCGWQSPMHYLWLTGESFNNLTASVEHYKMACASREVLRRVTRPTIVDSVTNMMTTFFGFDHRTLLPPFPPVGRGQDLIFGLLASMTITDGCVAHLPEALLHSPIEPRAFRPREFLAGAIGVDLCTVVTACLMRAAAVLDGNSASNRLQRLGQHLEQIGAAPTSDGARMLRETVIEFISKQYERLQARAEDDRLAPCWREDAKEACRLWNISVRQPAYHLPVEFLRGADTEGAIRSTLEFLAQFGALLREWPLMVEAYERLRSSGRSLATPAKDLAAAPSPGAP